MTEEADAVAGQLADLNAYGKALNRADEEEHVVSLTLEAMSVLLEIPQATFVHVRDGDPIVADSTHPERAAGDAAGDLARRAADAGELVTTTGREAGTVEAAVPAVVGDEAVAVLAARDPATDEFDEESLKPLEILATHVATALGNIRAREELERTQQTLSARAELLDLYGQLFRHHLRNDLNIVAGYTAMLIEEYGDDVDAKLTTINETVERSIDLVDRVSALHAEVEGIDDPEPRSLREAVTAAIEAVTRRYGALEVVVTPEEFDYDVYASGGLDSVFTNLLENAVIHNEEPVTVTIEAESPDPSRVVVTVADDGRGVPDAVRETLFQLGQTGPDSRGVGLGLGFVRRLVETSGGSVSYDESAAGGAAFRIELERT